MKTGSIVAAALALSLASGANAAVVVDQSPDATGFTSEFIATNTVNDQNFLAAFTLSTATTLDGASIYSTCIAAGCTTLNIGAAVLIKFRADVAGAPDTINLFSFNSVISAIDTQGSTANQALKRVYASFAPTNFAAGTYWFGMSGVNEIGLDLSFSFAAAPLWQLLGNALQLEYGTSVSAAFQLEGVGGVPEPGTWGMMIAGFGLIGVAVRRRRLALAA